MSNIVTIAYTTEGSTDQRFLESIILKTFEEVALKCETEIEVFNPIYIKSNKTKGFVENICSISIKALNTGINVLCIHTDADDVNNEHVLTHKVLPAIKAVNLLPNNKACKNLVAVIPVQMSEAWMLADKQLFKEELNTTKTDAELNINKDPEAIANPKSIIEIALQVSQAHLSKRRNRLTIGELYQPIGQKISISKLEELDSFRKFKISVENAFKELNYLH